ncbi:unnamed protein product [Boreogadus saida]
MSLQRCAATTTSLLSRSFIRETILSGCPRSVSGAAKDKQPLKKAITPQGRLDTPEEKNPEALKRFPNDVNPETKEEGGPRGLEPTRYGDWERKGRCVDF